MKNFLLFVVLSGLLLGWTAQKTYAQAVTGVTLNKHTLSLDRWASEKLTATVSPTDAANKNVNWQSSNNAIISVDVDGNVSANHDGIATVFVKTEEGGFADSCVVTCRVDDAANILEFSFAGEGHATSISDDQAIVNGYMPHGTDASNLTVASYQISPGGSISPLPETIHDFSDTVSFVVTAPDGTTQKAWKVYTMILPDLSGAQKVELKFSTAPQGWISDTVSWEESNIHFHVGYPNPSDTSWPPSASVGIDQDYSQKMGISLFPATFQFYLKDTSKVIVAASMYIMENCDDSCSFVYFQGENTGKTWYIDKMTREYHFYDLHQIKADYGKFRSFEGSFNGITFWIANKDGSVNHPPVANAGPDQTVHSKDTVQLDGSGSLDPEQKPLHYAWTPPTGISLDDVTVAQPAFVAPNSMDTLHLTFSLMVTDAGGATSSDQVTITVIPTNHPPVADAGSDQTVMEGDSVHFDGTGSHDADGDSLRYIWLAPGGIHLTDSTSPTPAFLTPEVQHTTVFSFALIVNDGLVNSLHDTVFITVTNTNHRPVAWIDMDQIQVNEGDSSRVEGHYSYDPDGDSISFHWRAQAGSGIGFADSNTMDPRFGAPMVNHDTTFEVYLQVSDGNLFSEPDTAYIHVINLNTSVPVAVLTQHTAPVNDGDTVYLDGSGSYDNDGDSLLFNWSGPNSVYLSKEGDSAWFIAPIVQKRTSFVFSLVVNDGQTNSQPAYDTVWVNHVNHAPVAQAGYPIAIFEGDSSFLYGSLSYDFDGDSLSYSWQVPAGFWIQDSTQADTRFSVPQVVHDTVFNLVLKVFDGQLWSAPDTCKVTVKNKNHAPVADAGKPFNVLSGKTGELNGSGSGDPDGDSLLFTWIAPAGITLSDVHAERPSFTAPEVTSNQSYMFALVVSDGRLLSDTAQVEVIVEPIAATMSVSATLSGDTIAYRNRHITLYWKNDDGQWVMENILSYNENGETYYAVWQGYWMITVDPVGDSAGFVSTFSGDVAWWAESNDIFITGGTETHINIHCIATGGNLTGDGVINGHIQRDTTTAGVVRNTIAHVDENYSGDAPAAGVTVYLYRSSDDLLLASTLTDNDGLYVFSNLPVDAYYLLVQLPGYAANTPWPVEVSATNTTVDDVNFLVSEGAQEITDVNDTEEMSMKLYPNPVKDMLYIQSNNHETGAVVQVYDLTGHLVITENMENHTTRLDMSGLRKGIYLLRMESKGKMVTRKFIRQ